MQIQPAVDLRTLSILARPSLADRQPCETSQAGRHVPEPPALPRSVEAVLRYGAAMQALATAKDRALHACDYHRRNMAEQLERIADRLTKP